MDSDDEESNDSSFESDEHSGEVAKHNVTRYEIQCDSNLRVDLAEVKALCKQVLAVSARTIGAPYNAINYRRQMFAGWAHFASPCVFFTINPLEYSSETHWNILQNHFKIVSYYCLWFLQL